MKPHVVFVHGINTGPEERNNLQAKMEAALHHFGVHTCFSGVSVAKWRSVGNFVGDLAKIPFEVDEAISDVMAGLMEPGDVPIVVVGHSMGQPLAVAALNRLMSNGKTRNGALLTVGGPMGDLFARPYFIWLPWFLWAKEPIHTMGMRQWHDVWNAEDPIPGGPAYKAFPAAKPHKLEVPGHPSVLTPLAEHGSYFGAGMTYSLIRGMAESLGG